MIISYFLPEATLDNKEFEKLGWSAEKIQEKTGICRRHIAAKDQFALDLAVSACENLFDEYSLQRESIDYVVYCTQSPDYLVPNNSSILQDRLKMRTNIGAVDILQGCSGFLYALSMAKGLLCSNQACQVLIVTTDTWSKYINPGDKSTRSIFGDGSTATLLTREDADKIGAFVFGTDGSGAGNLMVKTSGLRYRRGAVPSETVIDDSGNVRTNDDLFMHGPDIFNFTIDRVPKLVRELLLVEHLTMTDVSHFVFHQANGFMLEHLRKKLNIPESRFPVYLKETGNTVSSTIPIVLKHLDRNGLVHVGQKIMLVGFGVGYSWSGTILTT